MRSLQATPEAGGDPVELLPLPAVDEAGARDALQAEQGEGDAPTGKDARAAASPQISTTLDALKRSTKR